VYSRRDQTVLFALVTSLRVEGKQTHILCKPKTLPETASYKVLPLRNNIYSMDSICFLIRYSSHPSDPLATRGRGTHRFDPTTAGGRIMDFNGTGCENTRLIQIIQDKDRWRAFVNTAIHLRVA
jgi:hypothetical protein